MVGRKRREISRGFVRDWLLENVGLVDLVFGNYFFIGERVWLAGLIIYVGNRSFQLAKLCI